MVSYTGWSADGAGVLANSLSGLGQQLGQAYQNNQKQQLLSQMGELASQGKHAEAAKLAFASGHTDAGTELLKQAQTTSANTNLDAGLGSITGGAVANPSLPAAPIANDEVSKLIVQKAREKGIDPAVAIRVFRSEGAGGYTGDGGSSFGPFQLHYGGVAGGGNAVSGLGDEFTKLTGLDARDPKTIPQQVDFALSHARKNGWGAWHGWKGDPMAGINGQPVQVADASGRIVGGGQPPSGNRQALENKRTALMNLMSGNDYASATPAKQNQIKMLFEDTTRQLDRLDKTDEQAKQEPGYKLTAEMKAREQQVIAQGGDPKDPRNQHFINVGRYPKEDQSPLTATDKKAIMEADDAVNATKGVISSLQYAKQLSPKAMGFRGAGMLAEGGALVGNEASIATKELDNVVTSNTLSQLKTIFGGNPTEGEREILRQLEGSSSQPDAVRQKIYDRAIQMAETRMKFNQSRADELRGGTYYDSKPKAEAPKSDAPKYNEGQTATNPQTGEKIIFRNGVWGPA